jgi:uncharacterized membrane protein
VSDDQSRLPDCPKLRSLDHIAVPWLSVNANDIRMEKVIVIQSIILGRVDISLFTSPLIRTAVQKVPLNPTSNSAAAVTIFGRDGSCGYYS